jgi:hypothetical protein
LEQELVRPLLRFVMNAANFIGDSSLAGRLGGVGNQSEYLSKEDWYRASHSVMKVTATFTPEKDRSKKEVITHGYYLFYQL